MRIRTLSVAVTTTVVFLAASTVALGLGNPALASTNEQAVLDLTGSQPDGTGVFNTVGGPTSDAFGWQFIPNEDAQLTSITLWQFGSPNTSSVRIHEKLNDGTIGPALGTTFTYEPSPSDTTSVARSIDDPYYALTYRGTVTVEGTNTYWLVVTGGTTATRLLGNSAPYLAYSSGAPGRSVLTGNYIYNQQLSPGSQYFGPSGSNAFSFIYALRRAAPSSGSSDQVPEVVRTLTFTLPEGMTCAIRNSGSNVGLWVQLPAASDCSFAGGSEDGNAPQLLGWANSPDFPVSIAQRQIEKGWGAYELTNADGQVTSVFIPAGGSAQITGDARFFPVFAD